VSKKNGKTVAVAVTAKGLVALMRERFNAGDSEGFEKALALFHGTPVAKEREAA
jgi:hypothetical protein